MHEVTIIEMEHHFLYLPVYFARDKAFFDQIPAEYTTRIVQATGGTDSDTFRRLSTGEADIAICDPCAMLYAAQSGFVPAVLAGLIGRGAFWAVDTKSAEITELNELAQFQHIVTFHPGTTAHGIASRILRSAKGIQPVIESVRPLQEFSRLEDLLNAQKSAIALSPDVLRIEKFVDTNRDKGWNPVKLALAETIEYGHLLVTAVIARPEFANAHPAFISGFLKALQQALIRVRVGDSQVLKYASESFSQKESLVTNALKRANDAQVWASDITISQDVWLNAVQAHFDSLGNPFDAAAKRDAQRLFTESFKPYVEGARQAAIELVADGTPTGRATSLRYVLLLLAGAITGISGVLVLQDHRVAQLFLALGILYLPTISNYTRRKHLVGWNALLFVLFALVWVLHVQLHRLSDEGYIGSLIVLVLLFAETNFRVLRDTLSRD
jgi:ABC-type nitrate/sulfonate/bicarbonate transport system substrate-binding protein